MTAKPHIRWHWPLGASFTDACRMSVTATYLQKPVASHILGKDVMMLPGQDPHYVYNKVWKLNDDR